MFVVGPIFCFASGITQSGVLSQYTRRFGRVAWWEWGVFTIVFGFCGWLLGLILVTMSGDLLSDSLDIWSVSVVSLVVFLIWGTLAGLTVGLGQALIFIWKFSLVLGSRSYAATWKAGALWVAVSGASWAVGLGLSGLIFAATMPAHVPTNPDDMFPDLTPVVMGAQIISMLMLSVPISVSTGATLAWLLRHSDTRASHRGRLISQKVN
jgi:hypothetical protein